MAVVSPQQERYPEPPSQGLILAKLDLKFLAESYRRHYEYKSTAHGAALPNPVHLNTKESIAKSLLNWMTANAGKNTADCDNCNGPMDLDLMKKGIVPEVCVFCGVGPVEYESSPSNPKPVPPPEDDDEPESSEAPPPPKKEAKKVTKKIRKTKTSAAVRLDTEPPPAQKSEPPTSTKESKGGQLVKLPRAPKAPAEATAEVVSPEQRTLLDGVERIRTGLSGAMQGVYAEMWSTGKWFAEVQKSKAWTKHPAGFAVWKEFIEGCFGVLVNLKRVDELVTFYKANPKEVPKLDGALRLPLPKVRNPKPRGERAEREDDTSPAHDPSRITVAGSFKKKQTIALLNPKGKAAKTLKDRPTLFLSSDNGVVIKAAIGHNSKGLLVATVTIDRE